MNFIFHQIRRVAAHRRFGLNLCRSLHNPADMRPAETFDRRVRVFVGFGKSMVQAVRRHPADRARLQGNRPAKSQKIFEPFRRLESAMRQQTMKTESDSETARNPPEN